MKGIAVILRALQLFAHNAHHLASGKTFFEDHEHLGELYAAYEGEYDSVVERMIGNGESVDLISITEKACEICCVTEPKDTEDAFTVILETEKALRKEIEQENGNQTLGTQNLLQQLSENSEIRSFSLGQRLK